MTDIKRTPRRLKLLRHVAKCDASLIPKWASRATSGYLENRGLIVRRDPRTVSITPQGAETLRNWTAT